MRASFRIPALVVFAVLLASCHDAPLGPERVETGPDFAATAAASPVVSLLDWNIYVGTDLDAVIAALVTPDPADDLPAILAALQTLERTHFPTRAAAIADAIARTRPHVVGLQEVSSIDVDLTPFGLPAVVQLDFLPILQDALGRRKLDYAVGAEVTNIVATPFPGIALVDRDVLLVDARRVTVTASAGASYTANIGEVAPGVALNRGWVMIAADVLGTPLTFVNTHLESGQGADLSALRAAQALELMAVVGAAAPVILMGDLNDVPGSPMHQVVTGAGFTDVWAELHPTVPGNTCCHLPDLSNQQAAFDQRIDYILARGLSHPMARLRGQIRLLGKAPGERVPGPLGPVWPSDHGGLAARLVGGSMVAMP